MPKIGVDIIFLLTKETLKNIIFYITPAFTHVVAHV